MSTVVYPLGVDNDADVEHVGRFLDLPEIRVKARTLPVLASRAREALLAELQRLRRQVSTGRRRRKAAS